MSKTVRIRDIPFPDGEPSRIRYVTLEEGGIWISPKAEEAKGKEVHSIQLEDGREWDAVNGWR